MIESKNNKLPQECTTISEVRNEIDNIDRQIISLLENRFGYVREVVKYKEKNDSAIEATDRRNAVIDTRRKWAEEAGLNPEVLENIYNILIDYFIVEEKKIMNNTTK